jgi:hypothetical protein
MKKVITLVAAGLLVLGSMSAQTLINSWGFEPNTTVGPVGGTYSVYNGAGASETDKTDGLNARTGVGYGQINIPSVPAQAWDNQLVWEGLPIEAAKPYRFEIWVKATGGTAPAANFTCGTYSYGDLIGATQKYGTPVGTEWQRVNIMLWLDAAGVAALPLNGTVAGQIRFPMHFGVAIGTYYLDDYSFTQSAIAYADAVNNKITLSYGFDVDEVNPGTFSQAAFGVTVGGTAVAITSSRLINQGSDIAPNYLVEFTLARNILKDEVVKLSCDGPNSGLLYSGTTSPITPNLSVLSFNETINNFSTLTAGLNDVNAESLQFISDKNTLTVKAENVQAIKIYSISGKCVEQTALSKVVNISALPAGAYIVKATFDNSVSIAKFVK